MHVHSNMKNELVYIAGESLMKKESRPYYKEHINIPSDAAQVRDFTLQRYIIGK